MTVIDAAKAGQREEPEETEIAVEIDSLNDAYEAFRGLDRKTQIRMLRWLTDRLASDYRHHLQSLQKPNEEMLP